MNKGPKLPSVIITAAAVMILAESAALAQSGSGNEVMLSDDPSYCEVFNALSTEASPDCPDQPAVKTRGLSLSGSTQGLSISNSGTTGTTSTTASSLSSGAAVGSTTAATAGAQTPRAAAFGSIQFEFNSFDLTAPAKSTLDTVASVLSDARLNSQSFVIEGHTDAVGSASYNQSLSESRAQAVVRYLVAQHGISANRLSWRGRGESQPFAPNDPEGSVNRRVVILNAPL